MPRHILGPDDPQIILSKLDDKKSLYDKSNLPYQWRADIPDAFTSALIFFSGHGASLLTDGENILADQWSADTSDAFTSALFFFPVLITNDEYDFTELWNTDTSDAFTSALSAFYGNNSPNLTGNVLVSHKRYVQHSRSSYDIDIIAKWTIAVTEHHSLEWDAVTNKVSNDAARKVSVIIILCCRSELARDNNSNVYRDNPIHWLAPIRSSVITRYSWHQSKLLIPTSTSNSWSLSTDHFWSLYSSRHQAEQCPEPSIEETDLEGIDGYVVANGVTARIVLKQSLNDLEKAEGVRYLLEQSEHGQKVGVYLWCLDEDKADADNESSATNGTESGTSPHP